MNLKNFIANRSGLEKVILFISLVGLGLFVSLVVWQTLLAYGILSMSESLAYISGLISISILLYIFNNVKHSKDSETSHLFSLQGCYTRLKWWKTTIGVILVEPILILIMLKLASSGSLILVWLLVPLILITSLTLFWIGIASSVKRFHDINMSGLWVLLHLVPGIGSFIVFILNGFIGSKSPGYSYGASNVNTSSTQDIINARYANGEIDKLEYEEMLNTVKVNS